jgi:integrase
MRKGLVVRNVAEAADPPKIRQSDLEKIQAWTPKEALVFLNALKGHRIEAAYVLAITTGMRRGEVLGLRWRDTDLPRKRLAIQHTITSVNYKITKGEPKTPRSRRSVSLDSYTIAALRAHRKNQDADKALFGEAYQDQDLVFTKIDGSPIHPDYYSQCFDRTVAKLDIPRIRLHDLRHTHATMGLAAGISAKIMTERLGHSNVAFTQNTYAHALPGMQEEAAEKTAALIFEIPKKTREE